MSVELDEVHDFLAEHEPFSHLPDEELSYLVSQMTMQYVRRGETIIEVGQENLRLHVIRTGAVDIVAEDDTLLDRRDAGQTFGYSTLLGERASKYSMIAVEDSLLLVAENDAVQKMLAQHPDLARYYSSQSLRVSRAAAELRGDPSQDVLATSLSSMIEGRPPVMVEQDVTVREAAEAMVKGNVSSLLITSADQLSGILTDKDLRGRVVASGLSFDTAVEEVMTPSPITVPPSALAFEAMLIMSENGIHHVPVTDHLGVRGVVTSGDMSRLMKSNPIFLSADLSRRSRAELRGAYRRAAETIIRFIDRGAGAREAAQILTSVGDVLVRRLIGLFEEEHGPAPVPYSFVAVGSQGRREMGPASDQDNAIILSDDYDEAAHGDYFARLSTYVCTGLDEAGQVLCPGNMMAMNPEWRMTSRQWTATFQRWIGAPQPDALLNAQIYFDMRSLAGDDNLARAVHEYAVEQASSAPRLHAHLAALAARREPPLGFFRGFVVERGGEYVDTLDVKKGGTAGLVQIARLYAIKAEVTAVGTRERFQQAAGKSVSHQSVLNLLDAFDILTALTHRHQADQLRAGKEPTYHIDPDQLSTINRESLRDAFQIIKKFQSALATAHPIRSI